MSPSVVVSFAVPFGDWLRPPLVITNSATSAPSSTVKTTAFDIDEEFFDTCLVIESTLFVVVPQAPLEWLLITLDIELNLEIAGAVFLAKMSHWTSQQKATSSPHIVPKQYRKKRRAHDFSVASPLDRVVNPL